MARATPRVAGTTLVDPADANLPITVGTPPWYAWLARATTFAFITTFGRFTARKERRGPADGYWRAYRKHAGVVRSAYLGRTADLTLERLHAVAAMLADPAPASDTPTQSVADPAAPITDQTAHAASALPTGTVTFLFTDIEGSTQLWEQHPQAMELALAQHHALLREAIESHAGVVFQIIGDAFCAAFATAPAALRAALTAQRALHAATWGPTGRIRVRMALHTATVALQAGDYPSGPHFNRLARLLNAGHGGQVLLSAATHELLREHLPLDTALHDLGAHQLKDLSRAEQIFQLLAPDLGVDFPPLRTLDPRRTNLPAQPTPLIGREREIAELTALLRRPDVRLVTLTGPGGTGKTRLGLQVAAELLDDFAYGVYFINLGPLSDPDLVAIAIAQTLGVKETGGRPLIEDLQAALREQHLLLLLDNFEQVLAAAPLIAELLAALPRLKVLVTSREVLHLRGEKEFPVPPLAVPDPQHQMPRDTLSQYAAVQLFIARALDVKPDFMVTNENAPAVAEICVRLDGLPLAIELAAARIKLFPPKALLGRLTATGGLATLTGGPRDLPARQQTLRNTIAWSYNLLDEAEQTLFVRLGVFVGGGTLEAAEAVCGDQGSGIGDREQRTTPPAPLFDVLAALVDKSLVRQVETADGSARFTMLETIRESALEQLEASGEADALRQRHAAYYLMLAETARPHLHGRERNTWLDRLEVEHDNLRAALGWALEGSAVETGARIAIALAGQDWDGLWSRIGYWGEGWRWLAAVLAQRDALAPGIYVWALLLAAVYRGMLDGNPFLAQRAVLDEALALFRAAGDRSGIAYVRCYQGINAGRDGDSRAIQLLEEALALYQELGDPYHRATVLHELGVIACDHGDAARAVALLEQSLALCRERGYVNETARVLNVLGAVACNQGDLPRATARYWEALLLVQDERSLESVWPLLSLGQLALVQGDDGRVLALMQQQVAWFREHTVLSGLAIVIPVLGALVNAHGDSAQATAILRDGLILQQQFAEQDVLIESLEAFAGVAVGQGWAVRAARLLGAAEALRTLIGVQRPPAARPAYTRDVASARALLDDATFAAAWAAGRALTLEQAIAEALGEDDRGSGLSGQAQMAKPPEGV